MTAKQYIAQAKKLVSDGEYTDINDALCAIAQMTLSQRDCEMWHAGDGVSRNVSVILHAVGIVNGVGTSIQIWGSPDGPEPVSVKLL